MAGPRILLVIGGGIAAYKSCELVRLIRKGGGEVTCVLTDGGAQFVTPMSLAALSGNKVHSSLWDLTDEVEIGHIELSRQADLVVVCPATADLLAKMAAGIADDLGTTLILATDKPVLAVPAMNVRMWQHAATQRNVALLREGGVTVMEPDEGEMACGEFGPGRLPEPEAIWLEIADRLGLDPGDAGPKEIAQYLEALEPEEEPQDEQKWGGLGGLLASIIPRSTPRRLEEVEAAFEDFTYEELPVEEPVDAVPDLGHPLIAKKGAAKAAPPTDGGAINHEVNERQSAPEPVEIAEDPLEGQPDFDVDPAHRPLYGKHVLVTAGPTWEKIDPVRYKDFVVSSTRVRRLVSEGRVDEAGALLGHHYFIDGTIVRGAGRGRSIGVPTANLATANELVPPSGVYATLATIDGVVRPSVTNVGMRPTFGDVDHPVIETHVLDFERDLYDAPLRLAFVQRLRDERAFPDVDALRAQIDADTRTARRLFGRISL